MIMLGFFTSLQAKYNPYSFRSLVHSMKHLSYTQRQTIKLIKESARSKQEAIEMLAQVWEESSFGVYKVLRDKRNWRKSSYGWFHATLRTTKYNLHRQGIHVSYKRIRYLLLHNIKFNIRQYRRNINYWKKIRHHNLKQALACYNGGYKGYKRRVPKLYSRRVMLKMKVIKYLIKRHLV